MKNFKNKVAAITGAGSGIGQQLALLLAKEGCHLSLSDVNEAGLEATVALLKPYQIRVTTKKSMWPTATLLSSGHKKPCKTTARSI